MEVSKKKKKTILSHSHSTPEHIPEKSQKYQFRKITALFAIAKVWKQPMGPSTDKCIKKM